MRSTFIEFEASSYSGFVSIEHYRKHYTKTFEET